MKTKILSVVVGVLWSALAQAHYLWIEPAAEGARLYYGEAEGGLREKSPGKLDTIKSPQAMVSDAKGNKRPAQVERAADYFRIDAAPGGTVIAKEESLDVRDLSKYKLGFAKSNYYARYGDGKTEALALDLERVGKDRYLVRYRGEPLGGAKLEVIAPNTWVQEHKTDSQGQVEINTPWRGRYVLHVLHIDSTPGEFAGQKYESLRNHFTYVFDQRRGARPGAATPPKSAD